MTDEDKQEQEHYAEHEMKKLVRYRPFIPSHLQEATSEYVKAVIKDAFAAGYQYRDDLAKGQRG